MTPLSGAGAPKPAGGRRGFLPWTLVGAALLLLGMRSWIAAGHALLPGPAGDPDVVLANKLAGWLHVGAPHRWGAALLWEWLPALLFGGGLWLLLDSPCRPPRASSPAPRLPPWAGALFLAAAGGTVSLVCFQGIPHVQDSIAQEFQARVFASGRAWAPLPPAAEFFASDFLVQDGGRWYAQYPPGQAGLLAVGVLLGAPWAVNPVLGAASALFIHGAARRACGRATARLALALLCASPFVWFMSGERMNHAGTLFFVSAALYALAPAVGGRPATTGRARLGVGGLALGLAVSTRPACAAAVLLPLAAAVFLPVRGRRAAAFPWPFCAGILVGAAPLLLFNLATTGHALRSGYEAQWGSAGWGFGQAQWGPPHTPARGLANTAASWDALARYLFEWPVPSLLPLAALFLLRRPARADLVLGGTLVCLGLVYVPYFYRDLCFGPRFLYAGVPALVILSARGLRVAGLSLARRRGVSARQGMARVARGAALCAAAGLAVNLPVLLRWYGGSFWGVDRSLVDRVREQGIRRAVVFVRDHNRARLEALRRRGVRRGAAHMAVDTLDERWIDLQIARSDIRRASPAERARDLERRLEAAVADPARARRRRRPRWIDYRGHSLNAYLGLHAVTPRPEDQEVIYALHLGPENRRLLSAYPGRSAWLYEHDAAAGGPRLRPLLAAPDQITSR